MSLTSMSRGALRVGSLALATAFVVAGCAGTADEPASESESAAETTADAGEPVRGGVLTAALTGDPQTLDNGVNSGSLTIVVGSQIFEPLFALDATFTPRPQLAESYELSDDQLTLTITLREDVPFHNGEIMDSGDVQASLERWLQVSSSGMGQAGYISSIEAPDESTIVINLDAPSYSLVGALAGSVQQAIVLPEEIVAEVGTDLLSDDQLIGTGPYEFAEYTPGQNVRLTRFEDYASRDEQDWGGAAGAKGQYVDEIEYVFVADDAQRLNGLRTGQWNWAQTIALDEADAAREDPALTVVESATHLMPTLLLNHNDTRATNDLLVREALNLAIDKEALAIAAYGPDWLWQLTPGLVPPTNERMFSDVGQEVFEAYDPERAQELFEEAGVDQLTIYSTQTYSQFYNMAVTIQAALAEIGIDVEIEIYDFPTMIDLLSSDPEGWDISMTRFSGMVTSPTEVLFLNDGWPGEYDSPELDALMADFQAAADADEAHAVVERIHEHVFADFPGLILADQSTMGVYAAQVNFPDAWTQVFSNAWISE